MKRMTVLALIAVCAAACGSDTTSPAATAVGTWSLSTFDGVALPVTLSQNAAGKEEFTDDTFTLTSGLTYVETGHVRTTPTNGTPVVTAQGDVGIYAFANGAVTFTSTAGNGVETGGIDGSKMTIIFQGHTLVYLRGS